jgi:hypothetical protein
MQIFTTKISRNNFRITFIFATIFFFTTGCTIKLISSYDEQTDKNITALQKSVEAFLVKFANNATWPECNYAHHKSFYEDTKIEISSIKVRADAIPENSITSEQIDLLRKNLKDIEQLHISKERNKTCLSDEEIEPIREGLNSSFTGILKLEIAKKRGDAN